MSNVVLALPDLLHPRQKIGETAYRDQGTGEPILLIHGVGLNGDAWQPQILELSKTHRVIAIDMLGHGESETSITGATLDDYVKQVFELVTALGIGATNIVGHSMGGLVAIGFALAHPAKTLRLAVLNSVYRRTAEKRSAVQRRAREIAATASVGNVEEPLERWFGPLRQQPPVAADVRRWLTAVDPKGYAIAYDIFAASDEIFAERMVELKMPALFATGSEDENSSPAMASEMARAVGHGKLVVIEGERHMMNLTNPKAVNFALRKFLQEPVPVVDPKDLRKAFGTFMTGVTVVTTREGNGSLRGFTANSFSSVSLDPPLLLVCVSKAAASCESFSTATSYAVNILAENQKDVSGIFASKRPDKFNGVTWSASVSGNPIIADSVAWFDCAHHSVVDAGDHIILIGRVTDYAHNDASPLGYARGGYFTLGLEQSAVNAVSLTGRAEVGAILECEGKLFVVPGVSSGSLDLPRVGDGNRAGSASQLIAALIARGVSAKLGFLFAVFENPETKTQSIYYRGEATAQGHIKAQTVSFDDMPWDRFHDEAVKSMLRRYCTERVQGRYRIYSGDHLSGEVKELND